MGCQQSFTFYSISDFRFLNQGYTTGKVCKYSMTPKPQKSATLWYKHFGSQILQLDFPHSTRNFLLQHLSGRHCEAISLLVMLSLTTWSPGSKALHCKCTFSPLQLAVFCWVICWHCMNIMFLKTFPLMALASLL